MRAGRATARRAREDSGAYTGVIGLEVTHDLCNIPCRQNPYDPSTETETATALSLSNMKCNPRAIASEKKEGWEHVPAQIGN
jgi:hypothetical protein